MDTGWKLQPERVYMGGWMLTVLSIPLDTPCPKDSM